MLIATIITYNDWPIIKDCIESIENKVDKIIVVDGKFRDFPGSSKLSDGYADGYLFDLQCKGKIKLIRVPNYFEVEKRNVCLCYLNDKDTVLSIDADEVLEGNIPELDTDIGLIDIFEFNDRRRHRRYNRFFKFREGVHYWGKHYLLLDKDNDLFTTLEHPPKKYTHKKISEFHLIHKGKLRSQQRIIDKQKYYKILQKREAKINEPIN